ncbi:hypothetical protein [Paraglaciecola sp.]|uniref:hypothetical protein n=1 Tax=Paraglaciecola sp. TaxID=1920173 RepID=UPI00273DC307|nr:hypothetical protein [Paraglaciecola sp.]MDP5032914.1 hypothetical protein [Paraglaciecola sp.]
MNIKNVKDPIFSMLVCKEFARSPNVSKLVGVFAPAFFQPITAFIVTLLTKVRL